MDFTHKMPVLRYRNLQDQVLELKEMRSFGIPKEPYTPRPVKKKTLKKLKGKKK